MEIRTNEQRTIMIYEPPLLVKLGELLKGTHGFGGWTSDSLSQFISRV
jgi:hypothetical protein